MTEELDLQAYLQRIGYDGGLDPTVETLTALHRAHVLSIPFENLDILLGRPIRLDLASLQAKLVRDRRVGYCFEQNALFAAVLEHLAFDVTGLAARVTMGEERTTPRTHMILAVDIAGTGWLADVGFGGDTLLDPISFESSEPVHQGAWAFRLGVDGDARILWGLRPDGVMLCVDHESFSRRAEPETDPVVVYGAMMQGVQRHPELQPLVPERPPGVVRCEGCGGRGYTLAPGERIADGCLQCRGLGWHG